MERENVHPNNITGERQQDHINDTHAGDNEEGWKTQAPTKRRDDVDDDLYDDDSGSEIFFKEIDDEFLSGGGWIKELTENSLNTTTINSEFCVMTAVGNSRGIIAIWDVSMFRKDKIIVDEDGFIAVYGEWINTQEASLMMVVYAPQDAIRKCSLWIRLNNLMLSFHATSIVLGDFNEAIEGDENSKFFHGLVNNKFSRSRINGIYINGNWASDPPLVVSHIYNFHKQKFQDNSSNRPMFYSNLFKTLSSSDLSLLDAPISIKEIKDAVWDCEEDKTPRPDGFTFKFIKHYWDTIGKDFIDMIHCFEATKVVRSVVSEVQTAFIKDRQIIDGPLMVNEIISWANKKRKRLFILKVDFEKAFDSLDWKFLDHTMEQMGFSIKWRKWIHGCLNSAFASVLVNGSPTKEFKIQKGLCQGDHLSPFLIIIAVEALHVTLQEAKFKNVFEGVKVGCNGVDISQFQFADDALILGKWFLDNAKNLCRILRCFHMASGLKVNFTKSKFFGVGVSHNETVHYASFLSCEPSKFPCVYLGIPIGANMNKMLNWKPIIEKFHKRLTNGKQKNLSFGRWYVLQKMLWGLDIGEYGGLESVDNRYHVCLQAHGNRQRLDFVVMVLLCDGVDEGHLRWWWNRYELIRLVNLLQNYTPSLKHDRWNYLLDPSNEFSVSSMRSHIESVMLSSIHDPVRWNKCLSIKINIHVWRLLLDRLPTRHNLDVRGIDLDSTRCPVWDDNIETTQHLFVECKVAAEIWKMVLMWWDIGDSPKDLQSLITRSDSVNLTYLEKTCFDVVIQTTTWILWRYRNRIFFDEKPPSKDSLGAEIKVLSYT
ncbi:putative RNA-directed DNA polymerase, eukaryota, reverse transcriptase zinc-binding domain protein [Tanacetum coccineum]